MNHELLSHETELKLMKQLLRFPDVVIEGSEEIAPQHLALYLYELSNDANRFYESVRVLDDENTERPAFASPSHEATELHSEASAGKRNARLVLVETVASVLKRGLGILGISVLDKI